MARNAELGSLKIGFLFFLEDGEKTKRRKNFQKIYMYIYFMRKFLLSEDIALLGIGETICWIFLLAVLAGYLTLGE